jgi:transcriptional regulator of acetoin/glycerol metabolism
VRAPLRQASVRPRAARVAAAEKSVEYTPPELAERTRIVHAMNAAKWHPLQAAAMLGISRATLYRRLKQLNIVAPHRQ